MSEGLVLTPGLMMVVIKKLNANAAAKDAVLIKGRRSTGDGVLTFRRRFGCKIEKM